MWKTVTEPLVARLGQDARSISLASASSARYGRPALKVGHRYGRNARAVWNGRATRSRRQHRGGPLIERLIAEYEGSHTDVTMWFILQGDRQAESQMDRREANGAKWFDLYWRTEWPVSRFDPQMHRFAAKLTGALNGTRRP